MSTTSIVRSKKPHATPAASSARENSSTRKRSVVDAPAADARTTKIVRQKGKVTPLPEQPPSGETKQDLVLTLLSDPGGASIDDIMLATN